jgi:hypothetical protein
MKANSNLEEILKRLQQVATQAEAYDFSAPLIAGLNAALGLMKYRVFNTGKDSKGISFGKYIGKRTRATNRKFKAKKYGDPDNEKDKKNKRKRLKANVDPSNNSYTEYEKIRLSRGRQVNYKDLEFNGDLRRAIVVAKVGDTKAAIVIPNKELYNIAQWQSKQISKIVGQELKIFSFAAEEREINQTTFTELLNQLYARLFNS